jgi:phytoene/squalene synthetase
MRTDYHPAAKIARLRRLSAAAHRILKKFQAQNAAREVANAKQYLAEIGLSYRAAAPLAGVTYQYLSDVLNGHRTSQRLLNKIMSLPKPQTHN